MHFGGLHLAVCADRTGLAMPVESASGQWDYTGVTPHRRASGQSHLGQSIWKLAPGVDAQLDEDIPEVEFDGLDADHQFVGKFPIAATSGRQAGDNQLLRRQSCLSPDLA